MTTTFIDPPGPLENTTEPIDFTTSRLVTSISIEYRPETGTGLRESVWDGTSDADDTGGDFSFLYRTSTRSGSGPYTWTVRRRDPWPAGFRIRVKEAAEPVAPTTTLWTTIYECDLRTLGTVSIVNGANAVDGVTWRIEGANSWTSAGLRLLYAGGSNWPSYAAYGAVELSSIPGYDAAAPTALILRCSETPNAPSSNHIGASIWRESSRPNSHQSLEYSFGSARAYGSAAPAFLPSYTFSGVNSANLHCFGAVRTSASTGNSLLGPYTSGPLPSVEELQAVGGSFNRLDPSTTGLYAGFYRSGTNLSSDAYLWQIKIMQKV